MISNPHPNAKTVRKILLVEVSATPLYNITMMLYRGVVTACHIQDVTVLVKRPPANEQDVFLNPSVVICLLFCIYIYFTKYVIQY